MSAELTEIQELGLAFGVIHADANGLEHDSLLGFDDLVEEECLRSVREMFDEWRGILDREDLIKILTWLCEEGHRKEYGEEKGDLDEIIAWDF